MIKLKLDALGKHYNHRWIFKDLNFESDSTIIGIAGSNGSGKSTLLKVLTGLVQPDVGKVEWINPDSSALDMRADTGYAAPYIQLYGDLTCRENLTFLQSSSENKIESTDLEALATEFGIREKLDRPYKSLSSGQQQRIKILVAIQSNPAVLFLDEPGSNLDEKGIHFIRNIIEKRRANKSICLIASNLQHELQLCDQIISLGQHE